MRNYNMSRDAEMPCCHQKGNDCLRDSNRMRDFDCMRDSDRMAEEYVVAMAYVPWQHFTTVYEPDKALDVGTIFPELDKPFWAGKGMGRK